MDLDGLKSRQFFVTMPKTKSRLFLGFRVCLGGLLFLVAEFISPKKCTLLVIIVGNITPKSAKCIHSATKFLKSANLLRSKVCQPPSVYQGL